MLDTPTGIIEEVEANGDLRISLREGQTAEVGERFSVLNEKQEPIAQIKVVRSDSSGVVARSFQSFVTYDTLRRAGAGAGAGAAAGTVVPVVGSLAGAVVGAVIGSALARRKPKQAIESGMPISPVAAPAEH
jgi:phage tail tape-measure protein